MTDGQLLDGKNAVVTGGSRGIGRAVVERFARDGANVVFGYASNTEQAEAVLQATEDLPGQVYAVPADLGAPGGVATLFKTFESHLDGLDILVNNAAAGFRPTLLVDVTEDEYERIMAVNVKAVFLALQYAARHMRDGGRIVNMSTLNTRLSSSAISLYAGSKGAVEQFSAVAARELGSRGITVNVVSPGATDTDLLRSTNTAEGLAMAAKMSPLGRLGQPADVADVVAFLAGPDGRWLTGQNLQAAGGLG
jgi:3-oxoacyl-[acyl-carrier protein] reductase